MDRSRGALRHMEDFCQILGKVTAQKYNGSMEQIGKAIRIHSDAPGLDAVRFFELGLFCFLTGNSDMHLKNFSLLENDSGGWELFPAYDLVPVRLVLPEDPEELALTLNGKKNRLRRTDFLALAESLRLPGAPADGARPRAHGLGRPRPSSRRPFRLLPPGGHARRPRRPCHLPPRPPRPLKRANSDWPCLPLLKRRPDRSLCPLRPRHLPQSARGAHRKLVSRHCARRVLCKTEIRLDFCTLAGDLEVSTGGTDWISFRHTARWLST